MRSKLILLIFNIISLLAAFRTQVSAQNFKTEKRIYVWDVTLSMNGFGGAPNIWNEVQKNLMNAIQNISDEQTEIVVVPFQDGVLRSWNEGEWNTLATDQGKRKLIDKIKSIDPQNLDTTRTNICAGWEKAISLLDQTKRNSIFLLTDGVQNSQRVPTSCVEENIRRWCRIAQQNDGFAFYVMLTDNAKNETIERAIRETCRIESTEGPDVQFVEYRSTDKYIYFNLNEKQLSAPLELVFKNKQVLQNGFTIEMDMDSPHFNLKEKTFIIGSSNQITIELVPRGDILQIESALEDETYIPIKITNPGFPKVFCVDNRVIAIVKNERERVLTIVPIKE